MNLSLKSLIVFIHDLLWIPLSLILSYFIRFNLEKIPNEYYGPLLLLLGISVVVQSISNWFFGLYRGVWRFVSLPDFLRIGKAVAVGSLSIALIYGFVYRFAGVPRSVFVLYPLLLTLGLCVPRISYRLLRRGSIDFWRRCPGKRTLIVGAGQAGEMMVRDLLGRSEYELIGLVDDNPKLHGRELHGVRVLGAGADLIQLVDEWDVELVILAIPSASRQVIARFASLCEKADVDCLTLPSLVEMRGEPAEATRLRPVSVEDLLGRRQISLSKKDVIPYIKDKNILVTGGGGSIGSELCRQVSLLAPSKLIIFENSEYNLFLIEQELKDKFPQLDLILVLGDIKNKERVSWVFRKFKPNVVFHAAAYKHVPMLELNPAEAVSNNVYGTKLVADAADQYGAERFVLVSTDKAVNPANIMGATKRICELYCQNLDHRSKTCFITTRFGNVLGSAGSVVPLFKKQIESGGPVTVTHPKITRYFMTIPEAVSLILQAGSLGRGGEIFVLDMGKPVYIRDLAEQMIRLSGYVPNKDIKIVYTGLRPGEKLYEELLHDGEELTSTIHDKILLAKSRKVNWDFLIDSISRLNKEATSRNVINIKKIIKEIVPEYVEQN